MSDQRLQETIKAAIAANILPPDAAVSTTEARPWPLVLMTGLGAWLAAIPLFSVLFLIFGSALENGVLAYPLGCIILGAAVFAFRHRELPIFLEQLAVPSVLVGGGLLVFGFFRDLPDNAAWSFTSVLCIFVARLVLRSWMRVLLGVLAGAAFIMALSSDSPRHELLPPWGGIHAALAAWIGVLFYNETARRSDIESISTGWVLAVLIALSALSGMTFMAGGAMAPLHGIGGETKFLRRLAEQLPSALMAMGAAAWLMRCWHSLRTIPNMLAACVLVALAWLIPTLGGALLVLAACAGASRWRLATAAGVAVAWMIGAFYYHLSYPLAIKAVMMLAAGGILGAIAWAGWMREHGVAAAAPGTAAETGWRSRAGIALCGVAILAAANFGIWQKEDLIRNGSPVFIALEPVDPRSLMQGDFMRLNFRLPPLSGKELELLRYDRRATVVAKVDGRGVAVMDRIDTGAPLATGEIRIELLKTGSGLRPASDAWFFKEGEGERWAKARYGEFRIDGNGRALLVDLRGQDLEKL